MGINELLQIGNIIRKYRNDKGYTQKEMAKLCGIPYSTYSNYENNNREPSLEQLEKIAHTLEIDVAQILFYNEPEKDYDEHFYYDKESGTIKSKIIPKTESKTIAAHFDGDEYTEEELDEIKKFAEFVKSKRKDTPTE